MVWDRYRSREKVMTGNGSGQHCRVYAADVRRQIKEV